MADISHNRVPGVTPEHGSARPEGSKNSSQDSVLRSAETANAGLLLLGVALASSLASLLIIGNHIFQASSTPADSIMRVGIWALCSVFALMIAYYLGRRPGITKLIGHSSSHIFVVSLVFSGALLAAISLLIHLPQTAFAAANSKFASEESLKQSSQSLVSLVSPKSGRPKFSEHYWTPPTPGAPLPHMQLTPQLDDETFPFGDRPETLEVYNERTARTVTPASSKPDRTLKAEKPKKSKSTTSRTKRVQKKTRAIAAKSQTVQQPVKATPLVQTEKLKSLNIGNRTSCMDRDAARSIACKEEMGR